MLMRLYKIRQIARWWARIWMKRRARNSLSAGEELQVGFLLVDAAVWKFEKVYRDLESSKEFDPIIWIWSNRLKDSAKIQDCIKLCQTKGYAFLNVSEIDEQEAIRHYKMLSFLFFSTPYSWASPSFIFQTRRKERPFHCYVPYALNVSDLTQQQYGEWFFQNLDINFHPSALHKKIHEDEGKWPWVNEIVSGYPGIEGFHSKKVSGDNGNMLMIYAPHHTISNENNFNLSYATFEQFGEFMLELMLETKEQIDWVFKPHPLLFSKLLNHPDWGEDKAKAYFGCWEENASFEDGDYTELFRNSKGMIHDSGSFLAEFLATGQPVMYLLDKENRKPRLNDFGFLCLERCYIGRSQEEIRQFVQEVIQEGKDIMKEERMNFINSERYTGGVNSPSEEILASLRGLIGTPQS